MSSAHATSTLAIGALALLSTGTQVSSDTSQQILFWKVRRNFIKDRYTIHHHSNHTSRSHAQSHASRHALLPHPTTTDYEERIGFIVSRASQASYFMSGFPQK